MCPKIRNKLFSANFIYIINYNGGSFHYRQYSRYLTLLKFNLYSIFVSR